MPGVPKMQNESRFSARAETKRVLELPKHRPRHQDPRVGTRPLGLVLLILPHLALGPSAGAGTNAWTSQGPYAGSIESLVIDPASPNTLYAAADFGRVFKSTDGGANWTPANNGLSNWTSPEDPGFDPNTFTDIKAVTIDPIRPSTIYAAGRGGVYKSTDAAENWHLVSKGLMHASGPLVIDPISPNILYVVENGLFKSTDSGATWKSIHFGPTNMNPDVTALLFNPITPAILYALTRRGRVFKSIDSGSQWSEIKNGLPERAVWSIAIDTSRPTTLYAGSDRGLYGTADAGATWRPLDNGLNALARYIIVTTLAVAPTAPATIYAGFFRSGLFKSTDSGASWISVGLFNMDIEVLAIDPVAPRTLYAGNRYGGVYRTTDAGANWIPASNGLPRPNVCNLSLDPTDPAIVYAGSWSSGLYKSADAGASWTPINGGLPTLEIRDIAIDPITPTILYVGLDNRGVYQSVDAGTSWSALDKGMSLRKSGALAIEPTIPTTLYAGGERGLLMFRSAGNADGKWVPLEIGLNNTGVSDLAINTSVPTTLYAVTMDRSIYANTQRGQRWSNAGPRMGDPFVNTVAIDPSSPAVLYAGTYRHGVYKSTDSGASWRRTNNGLSCRDVFAVTVDPTNPAAVYAGTGIGVFKSTDGGANWLALNRGLDNTRVSALVIDPSANATIYAGTVDGVFGITQVADP